MTDTARPFANDLERSEWILAQRQAMSDAHPQSLALDSYEKIRQAAAARGDRAEPMPAGTSFTLVGRKRSPDET